MTLGAGLSQAPKKAQRGPKPKPAYAAAAELAWQYYEKGMPINRAARIAVEVLAEFGSLDLRELVPNGRGPLPTGGLLPDRNQVKEGISSRALSEFASRPQRPAKWGKEGKDEFTQPAAPHHILAWDDTVVQQVAAMVRKRKKASSQK